jgi:hypothetical protein
MKLQRCCLNEKKNRSEFIALTIIACFICFLSIKNHNFNNYEFKPKIKHCLLPLSDRPTKIAATQKILLPQPFDNFFHLIFSLPIIYQI